MVRKAKWKGSTSLRVTLPDGLGRDSIELPPNVWVRVSEGEAKYLKTMMHAEIGNAQLLLQ